MIISAMRAYYGDSIDKKNWTDTRSGLDICTVLEPATSIMVASLLVLGPVLKKWFSHSTDQKLGPDTATLHENPSHRFKRVDDIGLSTVASSSLELEVGVRTIAEQGPERCSWNLPMDGCGQQDRFFTDMERLAVKDGKAICVRKDLSVCEEA